MAKQKPHRAPSFNQSVNDSTPKIEKGLSPDNQLFRWVFLPEVIRHKADKFGFGKYKKDATSFLKDIEFKLYKKFSPLTWGEVDKKNHCGLYKKRSLSEKQREILESCDFSKYCSNEEIEEAKAQIYHLDLGGSHRLFGYKHNAMFFIVLNDLNHEFDKL